VGQVEQSSKNYGMWEYNRKSQAGKELIHERDANPVEYTINSYSKTLSEEKRGMVPLWLKSKKWRVIFSVVAKRSMPPLQTPRGRMGRSRWTKKRGAVTWGQRTRDNRLYGPWNGVSTVGIEKDAKKSNRSNRHTTPSLQTRWQLVVGERTPTSRKISKSERTTTGTHEWGRHVLPTDDHELRKGGGVRV